MARRNSPARWTLPDVVNPSTSVCFTVPVPDDPKHIAAFKGAIYALAKAYSWQNDDAHTAKDVAAVWMGIFDGLENCQMLTFRQPDICTLEASNDGGAHWFQIYSAAACVTQGILDAVEDGVLAGAGQQAAAGSGAGGQCYTYHVQLDGAGRWKCPMELGQGDTIQVQDVAGGWSDGSLGVLGVWYCADGQLYGLGQCQSGHVTDLSDPLPTADHMRLIGYIDSETPQYFDMYNTTYTVAGSGGADLILQANDNDLTDNDGSINFKVTVCKSAWVHTFDFTIDQQGWSIIPFDNTGYSTSYVSGVGFRGVAPAIGIQFPVAANIDGFTIYRTDGRAGWFAVMDSSNFSGALPPHTLCGGAGSGAPTAMSFPGCTPGAGRWLNATVGGGSSLDITKIVAFGNSGTDPF